MWLRAVTFNLDAVSARFGVAGRWLRSAQAGQSMVEYAIVAALIAIVAMAAVQALGGGIAQVFTNILNRISGIGG